MADTKEILWDAERLALFSNASATNDVESFRAQHKDFFPDHFWDYRVGPEADAVLVWQNFQRSVRETWQEGFPLENCIRLIYSALGSIWEAMEAQPGNPGLPVWPYQRAVMLLGMEPWRARFCAQCGKRFVADKPARRFCSHTCSTKARQASRSVSWSKHGQKWRATYEKRKAKGKVRAKSSRRPKR